TLASMTTLAGKSPGSATESGRYLADIWGGLAAMLVALPSSIAYGLAIYLVLGPQYAGQGAMAGMLGAVVIGLIAPLLGGGPRLISAPCAPAAAVLGGLVGELINAASVPPDQVGPTLAIVSLLAAVLQVGYGLIGGGRLIKFIPYPVVSGYLSGVGVIIFVS